MANLNGFDANQHEDLQDFSPIPAGKYLAFISESEDKSTKAGDGSYLQLVFEIIDGEHKGRKIWERLNLANQNAKAVEIAKRKLAMICRSVGVLRPKDSTELHNLPMCIEVKLKKRNDSDQYTNEIGTYAAKGEYKGVGAGGQAPQNNNANVAPWMRPNQQ